MTKAKKVIVGALALLAVAVSVVAGTILANGKFVGGGC